MLETSENVGFPYILRNILLIARQEKIRQTTDDWMVAYYQILQWHTTIQATG